MGVALPHPVEIVAELKKSLSGNDIRFAGGQ